MDTIHIVYCSAAVGAISGIIVGVLSSYITVKILSWQANRRAIRDARFFDMKIGGLNGP